MKLTFDTRPRYGHNHSHLEFQTLTKVTYMAHAKGYVMARRPNCSPFILTEKQWLAFPLYIGQADCRRVLADMGEKK